MCKQIGDADVGDLASADPMDIKRKAESVIQLAIAHARSSVARTRRVDDREEAEGVVYKALYRTIVSPIPGPLAEAIARLGVALGDRARLVTTNFDSVLEEALKGYLDPPERIKPFGLTQQIANKEWSNAPDPGVGNVLHPHGMLAPNYNRLRPVIMGESHFLEHGPKVRELITDQLANTCVVFVGVSISDPNLTGPAANHDVREHSGRPVPLWRSPRLISV